jgi:hypothetical protein
MRFGVSIFSVAGAFTLACGSGPISMDGGDGETGGDGDDDPQDLACADENGLVPGVLRLEPTQARAWLIEGGTEVELPLEGDVQAERLSGATAGDYIAVARIDGQVGNWNSLVHLFSRSTGERLWSHEIPGYAVERLWVADDGWVAGWAASQFGFVMSEAGMISLPDYEPLGAPALGHVAVFELGLLGSRVAAGWIDLADASWQPATPMFTNLYPTLGKDHHTLEYLRIDDGPAFVLARPGEAESIALPFGQVTNGSLFVAAASGRYRVVRDTELDNPMDAVDVRIDVESGEAVLVDPELPPGWSFLDCSRQIAVDGDGHLYYELSNDASAGVWAYDVESDAWTQLGLDLGLLDDMYTGAASQDVLVVLGKAQSETDCSLIDWGSEPDSAHLIRRDPALTMVLPPDVLRMQIDRQQRCVAMGGANGWEVRPLDGSAAVIEVDAGSGEWMWLD